MKKIIILSTCISLINSVAYGIDIQSKFRNTDKATFEGISDYRILRQGHLQTSFTYSLISNPYIKDSDKIGGVQDLDFSAVYGISKRLELGISLPFISTVVDKTSTINKYSGMSDAYIEGKINIFNYFSLVPVYIMPMGEGTFSSGSRNGGYGLKLVGGFDLTKKTSVGYTLGQLMYQDNKFGTIDQSTRTQIGVGINHNFNERVFWGIEGLVDSMDNRTTKILLNHVTMDVNSFKIRGGISAGLGNEESQSNIGAFVSLIADWNIFGKKEKTYSKPINYGTFNDNDRQKVFFDQNEFEEDVDAVDNIEEFTEINRSNNSNAVNSEKLKKELKELMKGKNEVKIKESNEELSGHSVIPFYTIKEVRDDGVVEVEESFKDEPKVEESTPKELINQKLSRKDLDIEDIKLVELRERRVKETLRSLEYFYDMYNKKRITKEKALTEFNWAKKLLKMRRESLEELEIQLENKYGKEFDENSLTAFTQMQEKESLAMNVLAEEKDALTEIIRNERKELASDKVVIDTNESEKPKQEVSNLKKSKVNKIETESERASRLEKEQKAALRDGRTLYEINQEKKNNALKEKVRLSKDKPSEQSAVMSDARVPVKGVEPLSEAIETPIINSIPENLVIPDISTESIVIETKVKNEPLKEKEIISGDTVDAFSNIKNEEVKPVEEKLTKIVLPPSEKKAIIPRIKIELKPTQDVLDSTKTKINALINESKKSAEKTADYKEFYDTYKAKMEEIKRKEFEKKELERQQALDKEKKLKEELQKKIDAENSKIRQEIIQKPKTEKIKDSGEIQIIELKTFKVKSIEERYEELKKEREIDNIKRSEEKMREWNVPSSLNIEEDGFIEKSTGPDY